jgi:hypothetical protein
MNFGFFLARAAPSLSQWAICSIQPPEQATLIDNNAMSKSSNYIRLWKTETSSRQRSPQFSIFGFDASFPYSIVFDVRFKLDYRSLWSPYSVVDGILDLQAF